MLSQIVGPLVRHGLTAAGGYLVSTGYLGADQATTAAGALAALIGVGLSLLEKRAR